MSSHFRSKLLLLGLLALPFTSGSAAFAHGSHGGGGEALEAGEFDFTPIITIEGHGGFDVNLDGEPKHYAIDGMFGGVFEWGLGNGGSFAIEAAIGPALVWGEAEHFYGKVHVHDHDDHEGHAHGEHDPHAWLSPGIAKVWLNVIASKLSEKDPSNASTYFSNASSASKDLDALSDEINDILDPIRDEKFVVFHDAYQYFEKHFDISASGAISLGDASDPSPARVKEIKDRVENEDIHCVLAEPQYKVGLVKAVIEGTHANMAVIDPLGVGLEAGPTLYDKLIRNLATNLSKCF